MQIFQLLIVPYLCCIFISPLDIEFEDEEEDEDKIIEQRRKQREELLKVRQILNMWKKASIDSKHFFDLHSSQKLGAPSEDSSQSWNVEGYVSGTSSPFKEVLNEGGEDSMMSTPNMSFDSPIIVTKSNFSDVDRQKDSISGETSGKTDSQTDTKEAKLEEEKRAKKRDMFAPEADMFAEEYSVSFYLVLFSSVPICNLVYSQAISNSAEYY